jgi:hypothetical protein
MTAMTVGTITKTRNGIHDWYLVAAVAFVSGAAIWLLVRTLVQAT